MAEGEIGQCEQTSKSLDSCCWNLISSLFSVRGKGGETREAKGWAKFTGGVSLGAGTGIPKEEPLPR